MARNEDLEITDDWLELTDANASSITFLNNGPSHVRIQYGANSTLPTDGAGDRYGGGQGERDILPPNVRAFARAVGGRAIVSVRTVDV